MNPPASPSKPKSVAERRDDFMRELRAIELPPLGDPRRDAARVKLNRFCRREVKALKDAGYAITTVTSQLTVYRNAIREHITGDEQTFALRHLTLTKKEWQDLRQQYEAKVTQEASQTRPIVKDDYIRAALENLDNPRYTRQAVALMLLTGRRSIEVLKVGQVELVPGKDDEVLFSGQAKTHEFERPPYVIPVLASAARIVAAWQALRAKKDFSAMTPTQVNAQCAKTLGDTVYSMYPKDCEGRALTPKDLRAIYALICRETRKPVDMANSVYYATILGHQIFTTTANQPAEGLLNRSIADSYEDFHLVTPEQCAVLQKQASAPGAGGVREAITQEVIPQEMIAEGAEVDEEAASIGAKV